MEFLVRMCTEMEVLGLEQENRGDNDVCIEAKEKHQERLYSKQKSPLSLFLLSLLQTLVNIVLARGVDVNKRTVATHCYS